MRKTILIIGIILTVYLPGKAQELFVGTDLVTSYMWRGTKCGDASVQPIIGLEAGGLTVYAWGSTEFKHKNNELDLTLTYEYKNFMLFFNNMYVKDDAEKSNYFNYSSRTTGHTFDAGLIYGISERLPLAIGWYTIVAGNDYKENDKRAWSSYVELKYPFSTKGIDFEAEVGITPWEGMYADKFNVTNMALKASKEFHVTNRFSFPVFAQLGVNPFEQKVFFVLGVSLLL